MKKYLILFFLLMPLAYANSVPVSGLYNVHLDGQPLSNFTLYTVYCLSPEHMMNIDQSDFLLTSFDPERNCTWAVQKFDSICGSNPCKLYSSLYETRLYLVIDDKSIFTDEINETKRGQYDMFISSDGSVELEYLKGIKSDTGKYVLAFLSLLLVPYLIFNILIEVVVAYFYFRKRSVPYKRLWLVVLANVISYIPFIIIESVLGIPGIILAEFVVIFFEAQFYKRKITELQWRDAFILSLLANIATIVLSLAAAAIIFISIWY